MKLRGEDLGFGGSLQLQRGAALNTNNWLLEFFGAFGFSLGSVLGKVVGMLGSIGKLIRKILDYSVDLELKGKVQLHEVDNQSKKELHQEAENILKSNLKKLQDQYVNEIKGNKNIDKKTIEAKKKQLEQKKKEFKNNALQEAWNKKEHEIKRKLKKEARTRVTTIIPKFAENASKRIRTIINDILRNYPPQAREIIYRGLVGSDQLRNYMVNTMNNTLLIAFSTPIEKTIDVVDLKDFTKKS